MDPISAAGIGLSVTSLALQVFSGCIKGYELLVDARDMPAKYQHIRMRLRIEQTRLLQWGEKTGLVSELLESASNTLHLDRNLVIEVLLEIQSVFRSCVKIMATYDKLVPEASIQTPNKLQQQDDLKARTLRYWEKRKEVADRLTWAMVRQDQFEAAVVKLIGLNDRIEGLLDRSTMNELHVLQQKSNLLLLQLTEKVDSLRDLADAMSLGSLRVSQEPVSISRRSTLVDDKSTQNDLLKDLAEFKIQHTESGGHSSPTALLLDNKSLLPTSSKLAYQRILDNKSQKPTWVEWQETLEDDMADPAMHAVIQDRLCGLATLLSSPNKPAAFRSPNCLGFVRHEDEDLNVHYGLVYDASVYVGDQAANIRSLRDFLRQSSKPSLTKRMALSSRLAESLMYLHAVNWIHKGLRSDNVLFCGTSDHAWNEADLYHPIISGFEFSRPDSADAMTIKSTSRPEHDLYRHPDLLQQSAIRSQKSHDIYSLGIILLEVAFWVSIESLTDISVYRKGARASILQIRESLLNQPFGAYNNIFVALEAQVGEVYAAVVKRCILGGSAIGSTSTTNEYDPMIGGSIQNTFYDEVLTRLRMLEV